MMIKRILFAVFMMISMLSVGQSIKRNQSNLPILSEDKAVITDVKGWVLQDDGLWVSANRKIKHDNTELNKSSDKLYKLGANNFEKIIIKEVLVDDYQYVVLIVIYDGGYFQFPDLRQGFVKQKNAKYFVFKSSKIDLILPKDININEAYAVNLEVLTSDDLFDYDEKDLDTKISYNILKTIRLKTKSQFTMILNVMPVLTDGVAKYRFRMLKLLNKKSIYQKYLLDENKDKLFRRSYYEIDYQKFIDFFRSVNIIKPDFDIDSPETFVEYYKRGVMRYDRAHFNGAYEDFSSAIELNPSNRFMLLYAYMGSTQHELENYSAAIQSFDRAILYKPKDTTQWLSWAKVYYNRGVSKYLMEENKLNACKDMNKAKALGIKEEEALKKIKKLCKGKYKHVITK